MIKYYTIQQWHMSIYDDTEKNQIESYEKIAISCAYDKIRRKLLSAGWCVIVCHSSIRNLVAKWRPCCYMFVRGKTLPMFAVSSKKPWLANGRPRMTSMSFRGLIFRAKDAGCRLSFAILRKRQIYTTTIQKFESMPGNPRFRCDGNYRLQKEQLLRSHVKRFRRRKYRQTATKTLPFMACHRTNSPDRDA